MSTEQESAAAYCALCGQPIEPGDPCHEIRLGILSNDNTFTNVKPVALACDCILHAAERHANGLPVYSDDENAKEYIEHIKCMNKATEPNKEQSYRKCPMCESGTWVDNDYKGTIHCSGCNWTFHNIS